MTDRHDEWRLLSGSTLVGTIYVDEPGMPWQRGRFSAEPAFSQFKPWFDEINALVEAGEFERFDVVYDLIEGALTLQSPSGPVAEFLLHIDQERAWFRWDEAPATS
ncbi:hypothetical protein ACGFZJ_11350 [Streptomyces sp. NPDC048253]|uniref:hypothetical protein n=1 Tax=Streptomyces sp. NPDC048253 TaxID=3365524 RepID=UPI0037239289